MRGLPRYTGAVGSGVCIPGKTRLGKTRLVSPFCHICGE